MPGGTIGIPLLFVRGAVVGAGAGLALVLQLSSEDLPRRAWFGFGVGALAYAGIDILRDFLASARGRGQFQRLAITSCTRSWAASSGRRSGSTSTQSQVSVVVAKFHRYLAAGRPRELFDIYPLVSKWGHLDLGSVTGGVGLLLRGVAGRRDQLVHRRLAVRDQPDVHEGLFLEGRDADPRALHEGGDDPGRREHDPGPALGPLDVAHHQLVPAAHGDADLVQPGRGDPYRPGDLPGLRPWAPTPSAPGASRSSSTCSPTTRCAS